MSVEPSHDCLRSPWIAQNLDQILESLLLSPERAELAFEKGDDGQEPHVEIVELAVGDTAVRKNPAGDLFGRAVVGLGIVQDFFEASVVHELMEQELPQMAYLGGGVPERFDLRPHAYIPFRIAVNCLSDSSISPRLFSYSSSGMVSM